MPKKRSQKYQKYHKKWMAETQNMWFFLRKNHIFTKSSKQENNENNMKNASKIPTKIIKKSLKKYSKSFVVKVLI